METPRILPGCFFVSSTEVLSPWSSSFNGNEFGFLLSFLALGQFDRQQTILEAGVDLPGSHFAGQAHRSGKTAEGALHMVGVLILFLIFQPFFSLDGQDILMQGDVHIISFQSQEFSGYGEFLPIRQVSAINISEID